MNVKSVRLINSTLSNRNQKRSEEMRAEGRRREKKKPAPALTKLKVKPNNTALYAIKQANQQR